MTFLGRKNILGLAFLVNISNAVFYELLYPKTEQAENVSWPLASRNCCEHQSHFRLLGIPQ